MKKNAEEIRKLHGLTLIHQKIPSRQIGSHRHDEHEIFLPIRGRIQVSFDDYQAAATPGQTLYVPPNQTHSFSASAEGFGERLILLCSDQLWKKFGGKNFRATSFPVHSLARELAFYLFMNIPDRNSQAFVEALLVTLISQIKEIQNGVFFDPVKHPSSRNPNSKFRRVIDHAVEDPECTVAQMAKSAGMSPRNFTRVFIEEIGVSPKAFLIRSRIRRAQALLKNPKLTVTEIALECGYSSLSKFIQTFQQHTGRLPGEVRE